MSGNRLFQLARLLVLLGSYCNGGSASSASTSNNPKHLAEASPPSTPLCTYTIVYLHEPKARVSLRRLYCSIDCLAFSRTRTRTQ
jgi:hypothetical protein